MNLNAEASDEELAEDYEIDVDSSNDVVGDIQSLIAKRVQHWTTGFNPAIVLSGADVTFPSINMPNPKLASAVAIEAFAASVRIPTRISNR